MSRAANVGVERLRELYAMMCGVPDDRVRLRYWREDTGVRYLREDTSGFFVGNEKLVHNCGTTGCAVGWACAYPKFQEQGLNWMGSAPTFSKRKSQFGGWGAVCTFFGIDIDIASYLFSCERYEYPDLEGTRDGARSRFERSKSEKRLVLARIRFHLLQIGAITKGRYEGLARQEARGKLTP